MKAAALYHRVSTRDQNPRAARVQLRTAARRLGYRVALDLEEVASGARGGVRPLHDRMMRAAREGRIDAVLVWKLDRFGRSAIEVLSFVSELTDRRVRFVCLTQGIDVGPEGGAIQRAQMTMMAAFAEMERELIVERTLLGLAAARRKGVRLGRPPARIDLRRVASLRKDGWSWSAIGGELGAASSTVFARWREHVRKTGPKKRRVKRAKSGTPRRRS